MDPMGWSSSQNSNSKRPHGDEHINHGPNTQPTSPGTGKNIQVLLCCQILYDLQKVYKVLSKANLGPESAAPNFYHQKQPNKLYRIFTWCQTHRIHGTGIFTYIWLTFMGFHVTSPIDLMGNVSSPTWTRFWFETKWLNDTLEGVLRWTKNQQNWDVPRKCTYSILTCHPKKTQCTTSFITQLQLTTHSQTNVQYVRFLWDILVIVASKTWLQYSGTCRMRNGERKRGDGSWPSPGNLIYIYI